MKISHSLIGSLALALPSLVVAAPAPNALLKRATLSGPGTNYVAPDTTNALTPSGYTLIYSNMSMASNPATQYYIITHTLSADGSVYDPSACAKQCDGYAACQFANIYYQNKQTGPVVYCTSWNTILSGVNSTNPGGWTPGNVFYNKIGGSNGYAKNAAIASIASVASALARVTVSATTYGAQAFTTTIGSLSPTETILYANIQSTVTTTIYSGVASAVTTISPSAPTATVAYTYPNFGSNVATCPSGNGTVYQDPSSGSYYMLLCGRDFAGANLNAHASTDVSTCLADCISWNTNPNNPQCAGVGFEYPFGKYCFLKGAGAFTQTEMNWGNPQWEVDSYVPVAAPSGPSTAYTCTTNNMYTASNGMVFQQECDVNYATSAYDIGSAGGNGSPTYSGIADAGACMILCATNTQCIGIGYFTTGGLCSLKTAMYTADYTNSVGWVSARRASYAITLGSATTCPIIDHMRYTSTTDPTQSFVQLCNYNFAGYDIYVQGYTGYSSLASCIEYCVSLGASTCKAAVWGPNTGRCYPKTNVHLGSYNGHGNSGADPNFISAMLNGYTPV